MRRAFLSALVALAAVHAASALSLSTPNMAFEINADATSARFVFPKNTAEGKDFWRLILDDGDRTEIPVFSHAQKGRVSVEGDVMTVEYDRLVSGYGDEYEIGFTLRIEKDGDVLKFTPTIANRSKVRVNECFAPLVSFNGLVGDKTKDVLYMPRSLGQRSPNPYAKLESIVPYDYHHGAPHDPRRRPHAGNRPFPDGASRRDGDIRADDGGAP